MTSGGKPKPLQLKRLQGNPGQRRLPSYEPQPLGAMPPPIPLLGEIGLQEWHRIGPELYRLGILTTADRAIFGAYCRAYERWCWAEEKLKDITDCTVIAPRSGMRLQSAYIGMANVAIKIMAHCAAEIGLTPSGRTRLAMDMQATEDALETFLAPERRQRKKA